MSSQSVLGIPPVPVCGGDVQSQENFCSSQPQKNPDGTADGDTIFVRTDCATRVPLDPSQQDPIYQNPSVPLDRGQLADILASWQGDSCDVTYKFLFNKFEVRGKAWADNQLGSNGDGLKKQIEGCGALTN